MMETNTAFFNKFGPLFFIIAHLTTGIYGILFAMPKLYQSQTMLFTMQVVACFGLSQVMICWYIIRKTDFGYNPDNPFYVPKEAVQQGLISTDSAFCKGNYEKDERTNDLFFMPSRTLSNDESRTSQGFRNALSFTINVTTCNVNGLLEKKSFPYWSWIPCFKCQMLRPPRCHHCILCQKCILKRDHHCYFTGRCIGVKNQGQFIVFMFWAVFVTLFGTFHMLPYTYLEILPITSYVDFIPPISMARVILGYVPISIPFLGVLFWGLLFLTVFSLIMLYEIINVTIQGVTTFELGNKIKVTDSRSLSDRWYDVLGDRWLVNIFIPFKVFNESKEDALLWSHIKL